MIIYTLSGLGNVKPIFIRFAGQFNDELFFISNDCFILQFYKFF